MTSLGAVSISLMVSLGTSGCHVAALSLRASCIFVAALAILITSWMKTVPLLICVCLPLCFSSCPTTICKPPSHVHPSSATPCLSLLASKTRQTHVGNEVEKGDTFDLHTARVPIHCLHMPTQFFFHTHLQEPTQAELDPTMEAIVVSKETLAGAEAINKGRANRGFRPLVVVIVPVIGAGGPAGKLSSTQLRAQDAAAAAAH